jgi:hypothetical protein
MKLILKGLSHEMNLAFDDMYRMVKVLGLNRRPSHFLNFCAGLTMLAAFGFLASYWSAGYGRFLQVSALASHWLADCANFTPMPKEHNKYS